MASSSSISDIETACANVSLEDEEEGGLVFSPLAPVAPNSPERDNTAETGSGSGYGGDGGGRGNTAGRFDSPEIMQVDLHADKASNSKIVSAISTSNFQGTASKFCGIDTRVSSQNISQLSQSHLNKENSKLSDPNIEEMIFTDPKRKRNEDSGNNNTNSVSEEGLMVSSFGLQRIDW
ncbi:hypothetical protein LguiA_028384 [Lonicera macranthoides]